LSNTAQGETSPVEFMKERYASRLNTYFTDGTQVNKVRGTPFSTEA
jgi:hypothetical protein